MDLQVLYDNFVDFPTILLSGMGRSGTTWLGEILNYRKNLRVLFEPFLAAKVPEAKPFDYLPYLRPQESRSEYVSSAAKILSGKASGPWANKYAHEGTHEGLLIKDIRTNLMLAWLRRVSPELKIVLIIRHPLQVAHSWIRLGWKKEAFGTRTNFGTILDQPSLLDDFPGIRRLADQVDPDDLFQDVIFQWCVYHAVPLSQLEVNGARVVFYEDVVLQPAPTLELLLQEVGLPYDSRGVQEAWSKGSITNYLKRDHARTSGADLVQSWQAFFSEEQVRWASAALRMFGLHKLYDGQGIPTGHLKLTPEPV